MQYNLSWNNKIYGSFSLQEIKELYEKNRIPIGAYISINGNPWQLFDISLLQGSPVKKNLPPKQPPRNIPVQTVNNSRNIIPWSRIFSPQFLKKKTVLWLLLFFALPFVLAYQPQIAFVTWGIYFCLIWTGVFCLLVKPSNTIIKSSIHYGLFTALIGIPLLLAAQHLPIISSFYKALPGITGQGQEHSVVKIIIGFILGVGICEELTKIVPLVLFLDKKNYTAKSMIFAGIISGFGFAVAENIGYAKIFGLQMKEFAALNPEMTIIQYAELLSTQLLRFISLPLLHAAWTGIFAWFVWNYFREKDFSYVWIGLLFTAILHGLYDSLFIVSSYLSFGVGLLSIYLLFAFLSLDAGDDILDLKLNFVENKKEI